MRRTQRRRSSRWLTITLAAAALGFGPLMRSHAGENDVVQALKAARKPSPSVWGSVNVGAAVPAPVDPRAAMIAQKLGQIARPGPAPARQGIAPAQAADGNQTEAIHKLKQASPEAKVYVRPGNQTVLQIRGGVLQQPVAAGVSALSIEARAERTARTFLQQHRQILLLENPDQELKTDSHRVDELGQRHIKFNQAYKDLPVWPGEIRVHLDPQGNVTLMDGAYIPTPGGLNVEPKIAADAASKLALESLRDTPQLTADHPALIIYAPLDKVPRLAWKTEVSSGVLSAWTVLVDAQDGRILNKISLTRDANVGGSAADLGGVNRNINVWSADGKFYMIDTTKPSFNAGFDPVKDPHGTITIFDARLVTEDKLQTVYLVESPSANTWLPDAVSALYNFGQTYDYYREHHSRKSVDGQDGTIRAAVRVDKLDNAFWNGQAKIMVFGNAEPFPNATDVVAHELTHGVTQFSADLIYELQPGALNESFSDIFGEMVEAKVEGKNDWKLGTKLGKIARDMKNPGSIIIGGLNRPFPSKMSEYLDLPNADNSDHGGVHLNSSIFNHCYYLLAEGLPGAIGIADAEKIFYRCLTQHLGKQSQFIDARLGCVASAEEIFGKGSTQATRTAEAFDAVEIFDTPATPEPPRLPPVQGEDSTILIGLSQLTFNYLLGRREGALGDPANGVGLVNFVTPQRPSVTGDGSTAVFVSSLNDLGVVSTDNPNTFQTLGVPGLVYSVAVSPDGSKYSFVLRDQVTGQPDNSITVIDLRNNTQRTFNLLLPVADGNPANLVLYAESMVFSSDGTELIYDAVSQIQFGAAPPVQRWSMFKINLPTESTTVLVPPLEGYDTGNPNLGRIGNRYLTFDANELATTDTYIVNLDLFTGDLGVVGYVGNNTAVGYPSFSGDESAIIYAARDQTAFLNGYSLVRQPLSANRLAADGDRTLWFYDVRLGGVYRRGTFVASNALPNVTVTSPTQGATFTPPATISISAQASDADGAVAKVEFYDGAEKLGEDSSAPYQFSWTNVGAGTHRIIARAIDDHGGTTDSDAVTVQVGTGTPARLAAIRTGNSIRLSLTAGSGSYTIQESTNLQTWADQFQIQVGTSGEGSIDDMRALSTKKFYRARKN